MGQTIFKIPKTTELYSQLTQRVLVPIFFLKQSKGNKKTLGLSFFFTFLIFGGFFTNASHGSTGKKNLCVKIFQVSQERPKEEASVASGSKTTTGGQETQIGERETPVPSQKKETPQEKLPKEAGSNERYRPRLQEDPSESYKVLSKALKEATQKPLNRADQMLFDAIFGGRKKSGGILKPDELKEIWQKHIEPQVIQENTDAIGKKAVSFDQKKFIEIATLLELPERFQLVELVTQKLYRDLNYDPVFQAMKKAMGIDKSPARTRRKDNRTRRESKGESDREVERDSSNETQQEIAQRNKFFSAVSEWASKLASSLISPFRPSRLQQNPLGLEFSERAEKPVILNFPKEARPIKLKHAFKFLAQYYEAKYREGFFSLTGIPLISLGFTGKNYERFVHQRLYMEMFRVGVVPLLAELGLVTPPSIFQHHKLVVQNFMPRTRLLRYGLVQGVMNYLFYSLSSFSLGTLSIGNLQEAIHQLPIIFRLPLPLNNLRALSEIEWREITDRLYFSGIESAQNYLRSRMGLFFKADVVWKELYQMYSTLLLVSIVSLMPSIYSSVKSTHQFYKDNEQTIKLVAPIAIDFAKETALANIGGEKYLKEREKKIKEEMRKSLKEPTLENLEELRQEDLRIQMPSFINFCSKDYRPDLTEEERAELIRNKREEILSTPLEVYQFRYQMQLSILNSPGDVQKNLNEESPEVTIYLPYPDPTGKLKAPYSVIMLRPPPETEIENGDAPTSRESPR